MNLNRREFLASSAGVALGTSALSADRPLTTPPTRSAPAKRKLALLTTTYHYLSHAYHIAGRFLNGYNREDGYHFPDSNVVSVYVEQQGPRDLSKDIAKKHGLRHSTSIADALTLGTDKLANLQVANLAIAICVVWDNPKAIYDYRQHQRRTRSNLPIDPMTIGWKENYEYLISREGELKGVVQNLPWEFLVHMVNNRTPGTERDWAIKNYMKKRVGIGGIYKEIVYDKEMLRTERRDGGGKGECRLTGNDYTLEGVKKYGGVCAQQADFSARVAKSIAVPAEYV